MKRLSTGTKIQNQTGDPTITIALKIGSQKNTLLPVAMPKIRASGAAKNNDKSPKKKPNKPFRKFPIFLSRSIDY